MLKDGRIEQVGSPIELYRRPANLFVAQFIGSPAMNIVPATLEPGGEAIVIRHAAGGAVGLATNTPLPMGGGAVSLGVRPEDLVAMNDADALFEGRVKLVEQLGEVQMVYLDIGRDRTLVAKPPGTADVTRGSRLRLRARPGHLHLSDTDGN